MAKYVVSVCCDLVKHSEAWRRIPREPMAALMGEYKHLAEELASQYGSFHTNFTGDGHFLLFENADVAVRFGLILLRRWRQAFEESPALEGHEPLPLRVGIHFGDETQLDDGQAWVGRCGNVAKRIESQAEPDTAYVSEGLLDLIDLPLYSVSRIGVRLLKGDHVLRRVLYRVDAFDEAAFRGKPDPDLTASDWFLKAVAMIGTPAENTDAEAECYQEALRLRPDYAEAHNAYGVLLRERGEGEEAEGHYQQALELRPDFAKAHNNYGNVLQERGEREEAEAHYKEALRLRPEYPEAHNNYGNLLQRRGEREEAEAHYKEALRLRPEYSEAHYNYAILLKRRGHPRSAKHHFEEAFRLAPDDPQIKRAYEEMRGGTGRG